MEQVLAGIGRQAQLREDHQRRVAVVGAPGELHRPAGVELRIGDARRAGPPPPRARSRGGRGSETEGLCRALSREYRSPPQPAARSPQPAARPGPPPAARRPQPAARQRRAGLGGPAPGRRADRPNARTPGTIAQWRGTERTSSIPVLPGGCRCSSPASTTRMFPQTGRAVVAMLERLGVQVDFPLEQTCCGQMHFNTGYAEETVPLVRRFVRAFADSEVVVSPSASCVGMVRDYYSARGRAVRRSDRCRARSRRLTPRVLELTELLVDRLGVEDVGAFFPRQVTYHPTCHSLRMLDVGDRPLRLLRAVRGIEVLELPEAEQCCGFGGTFAIKNADTSIAMLSDKVRTILDTGAEVCVSADNSCLMQIGGCPVAPARRRAHDAPRRDPGADRPRRDRRDRRADRRPAASRRRRACALADTQLRHNLGHATQHDPRQARRGRRPSSRTGSSCGRPAGRSRSACCAISTSTCWSSRPRCSAPAASCTGRAMPRSATGSSATSILPTAPTRW